MCGSLSQRKGRENEKLESLLCGVVADDARGAHSQRLPPSGAPAAAPDASRVPRLAAFERDAESQVGSLAESLSALARVPRF